MRGSKKVIQEIAFDLGLPKTTVELIVRSQFKMLHREMQKDTVNPVRLIYLGVFGVNPNRMKYVAMSIKARKEKKLKEKNNGTV